MNKLFLTIISIIVIFSGCSKDNTIQMSTTTSLNDSGLLDELTEAFYNSTNIKVEWISVGSGEAMEIAKSGEVDLAFLHSPIAEKEFVKDGYSMGRNIVMSNNFLIVGPTSIAGNKTEIINEITNNKPFVSRDDKSGTHKKELEIFKITPTDYISSS